MKPFTSCALALGLLLAPSASAHELAANEPFLVPLPAETMTGSILTGTLIGPPAGPTVVHARLDLTFETSGNTPASDVVLELGVMADGEWKTWVVEGSDLGWGSGAGTFTATIETEELAGQVSGLFGGSSIVDLGISSHSGGVWGKFVGSVLTLTLNESLERDVLTLPVASGGVQTLSLDAGRAHAGAPYLLLGTLSGITPGALVQGGLVPLNPDAYTLLTAQLPNNFLLPDSLGTLDGEGRATAHFVLPGGAFPILAGLEMHHAYLVLQGGTIEFASNPATLRFE